MVHHTWGKFFGILGRCGFLPWIKYVAEYSMNSGRIVLMANVTFDQYSSQLFLKKLGFYGVNGSLRSLSKVPLWHVRCCKLLNGPYLQQISLKYSTSEVGTIIGY